MTPPAARGSPSCKAAPRPGAARATAHLGAGAPGRGATPACNGRRG